MTSDTKSSYTFFRQAGPFIQPLPIRAMKSRADILASLPSAKKDVKVLPTIENLKQVGLYILDYLDSMSESSNEDVDPLAAVSSPSRPRCD